MEALIYKSTGSFYLAKDESGKMWNCKIRGKLKIADAISTTNPIAVGDKVTIVIEDEEQNAAIITEILVRNNYIVRSSPHNKYQKHIIASNLDLAVLVATIKDPRTSQGFMDRFLVTAEAYHIPILIIFNKSDKHTGKVEEQWQNKKSIFEKIGYFTLTISTISGEGIPQLKEILKGKTSLLSGHSGVGKSSLINVLIPNFNLRTTKISESSGKGQHTTTFAEMFDLPLGGRIIDTPGIKELGIVDFERADLAHYFPEMSTLINECKFHNCIHLNEPGCAVKKAVAAGEISLDRYESYLIMLDGL